MSRYSDEGEYSDYPELDRGRWERNSKRVLKSARGRQALTDLIAALDALPEKRLIYGAVVEKIVDDNDQYQIIGACAIGAYAMFKGKDPKFLPDEYGSDIWETAEIGKSCGMTYTMAWNIAFLNDEELGSCSEEERWQRVRDWAVSELSP